MARKRKQKEVIGTVEPLQTDAAPVGGFLPVEDVSAIGFATTGFTPAPAEPEPELVVAEPEKPKFEVTFPELDKLEMDRVKRVINNRDGAWRISDKVTHQRDYGLWGVHQYADKSRNTFARSFYFRELENAKIALAYTQSLLG